MELQINICNLANQSNFFKSRPIIPINIRGINRLDTTKISGSIQLPPTNNKREVQGNTGHPI